MWQVKEWRIDRLKEHLRAEGVCRQLFGTIRPVIVAFGCIGTVVLDTRYIVYTLALLGLLTLAQLALRKQRTPVWTKKAIILVVTSLIITILDTAIVLWLLPESWLVCILLIPILQSLYLYFAWLAFYPLDSYMKKRVMKRAQALREQFPDLTVIGITGSVGKTTTKELLAHILSDKNPLVTPAHVNTEMGVSMWLTNKLTTSQDQRSKNQQPMIAVIEMGAYRQGEIKLLCNIVQPTIGIITFIGKQHIALFGSQEKLCKAKGELFGALPKDGLAILNGDSPLCDDLKELPQCPLQLVGTGGRYDIEAFDIEETSKGITFRSGNTAYTLPMHGTHNVSNALLAITAALHVGMSEKDIAKKLRTFVPPNQTFTVREEHNVSILDDTHNGSEESFRAAINWAKGQPFDRKVLLTSGLIELGQQQDQIHTKLGTEANKVFDRVIFTHKERAKHFEKGYGKPVELFSKTTEPVDKGSLLVCEGRMSKHIVNQLLPKLKANKLIS